MLLHAVDTAMMGSVFFHLQLSSGPEVAAVKGEAALAVSDFIRSADTFQFDLLENPAISQLATDAKYGPLHKLLTTVIDGDVMVCPPRHFQDLFQGR